MEFLKENVRNSEDKMSFDRQEPLGFVFEYLCKAAQLHFYNQYRCNNELISKSSAGRIRDVDLYMGLLEAYNSKDDYEKKKLIKGIYRSIQECMPEIDTYMSFLQKELISQYVKKHHIDDKNSKIEIELLGLHAPADLSDIAKNIVRGQRSFEELEESMIMFCDSLSLKPTFDIETGKILVDNKKGLASNADYISLSRIIVDNELGRKPLSDTLFCHICEYSFSSMSHISGGIINDLSIEHNIINVLKTKVAIARRQSLISKTNDSSSGVRTKLNARAYKYLLKKAALNKNIYKLCQASSYTFDFLQKMARGFDFKNSEFKDIRFITTAITNFDKQTISFSIPLEKVLEHKNEILNYTFDSPNSSALVDLLLGEGKDALSLHAVMIMALVYRQVKVSVIDNDEGDYLKFLQGNTKNVFKKLGSEGLEGLVHDVRGRVYSSINDDFSDFNKESVPKEPIINIKPEGKKFSGMKAEPNIAISGHVSVSDKNFISTAKIVSVFDIESIVGEEFGPFEKSIYDIVERKIIDIEGGYNSGIAKSPPSLRDMHAALCEQSLCEAKSGEITTLFLLANPGMGKTTSILSATKNIPSFKKDGLFISYFSPRTGINDATFMSFIKDEDGSLSDIATHITDSVGIKSFKNSLVNILDSEELLRASGETRDSIKKLIKLSKNRRSICAIAGVEINTDDTAPFRHNMDEGGDILYVTHKLYSTIKSDIERKEYKVAVKDKEELLIKSIQDDTPLGVFKTLGQSISNSLKQNPLQKRLSMIGSIQGFKTIDQGTTMNGLNKMFKHNIKSQCLDIKNNKMIPIKKTEFNALLNKKNIIEERKALQKRIPSIIVMVDELAGDGAGALLFREFKVWLYNNFIVPLVDEEPCNQFKIVLIGADASLTNENAVETFFKDIVSGDMSTPSQMIIGEGSAEKTLFANEGSLDLLGKVIESKFKTLFITGNSFPAKSLSVKHVLLNNLSFSKQIKTQKERSAYDNAHRILEKSRVDVTLSLICIKSLIECKQIEDTIYREQVFLYYQDKTSLEKISEYLVDPILLELDCEKFGIQPKNIFGYDFSFKDFDGLSSDDILTITRSTMTNPLQRREVSDITRKNRYRIFLATQSASRGISFPLVTKLVVHVQNFSPEGGMAEINQVIYRGRGGFIDYSMNQKKPKKYINCDVLNKNICFVHEHSTRLGDFQSFGDTSKIDEISRFSEETLGLSSNICMLDAGIDTRINGFNSFIRSGKEIKRTIIPIGQINDSASSTGFTEIVVDIMSDISSLLNNKIVKENDMFQKVSEIKSGFESFKEQNFQIEPIKNEFGIPYTDMREYMRIRTSNDLPLASRRDIDIEFNTEFQCRGGLICLPIKGESFNKWMITSENIKVVRKILNWLSELKDFLLSNIQLKNKYSDFITNVGKFSDVFEILHEISIGKRDKSFVESITGSHKYILYPIGVQTISDETSSMFSEDWEAVLSSALSSMTYGAASHNIIAPVVPFYKKVYDENGSLSNFPFLVVSAPVNVLGANNVLGSKAIMMSRQLNIFMLVT